MQYYWLVCCGSWQHIELHTRCLLLVKHGDLTETVVQRGGPCCNLIVQARHVLQLRLSVS